MSLFRKKKKKHTDDESEYVEVSLNDSGILSSQDGVTPRGNLKKSKNDNSGVNEEVLEKLDSLVNAIQAQQAIQAKQLEVLQKQSAASKSKHRKKKVEQQPSSKVNLEKKQEKDETPEEIVGELLQPKAVVLEAEDIESEDDPAKFTRDVRRAFQFTSSQLLLLVLMTLGYFTVDMIDEYLAPFFWAVLLSIMLQKPKKILLNWSAPMKTIDEREDLGYFASIKAKFTLLVSRLKKPAIGFAAAVVVGKISCFIFGWFCWIPWFSLVITVAVLVGIVVAIVAISKADTLEGFFTTVLVFGFLLCVLLFILTFGFKAVTETGDFAFKIQALVEEKIHDPKWGTMMTEYGITEESINEGIDTGRTALSDWMDTQGYNLTEIEETIISYGNMLSGAANETEIPKEAIAEELVEVEEGSYMDYIPNISVEELQGHYDSLMEVVDMEAISSTASSVGSVLFSSTSGIVGVLSSIVASLLGAVDALLQFIVFIGALFYFMAADESFVATAVRIVPVTKKQQKFLSDTIHQNIIQVFVTSFLLSFSHGIATLIYFSIFNLDFAYSSAFIVGAMALFPLTSAWLIYAPSLLIAYLHGSDYVLYIAIGLFILEQAMGMVDESIFEMIPGSSPYLTGIGLAVGVSTFGFQGILIGPMLIVTTKTVFDIFCINVAQPEPPKLKQD